MDSTLEITVQDQNTVEAYIRLMDKILQAAENNIPRTATGTERKPTVPWWKKECKTQQKILRTEYRKLQRDPNNKNKIR